MLPLVAIVGRPNVGKSTLFNQIIARPVAVVRAEPGITRDRLYAETDWNGFRFALVDTGGIDPAATGEIPQQVLRQAQKAIEEADLILFVVDARTGVVSEDQDIAKTLRTAGKPVLLVANKVDGPEVEPGVWEFLRLGLGEPLPVAAEHRRGLGDLLDAVVERLKELKAVQPAPVDEDQADVIRVAIVGRPNVGKSSLVNRILGEERVVVSNIPGTTRDPVDTPFRYQGRDLVLVDTAGLRRPGRVEEPVEKQVAERARRALERSDVAVLVLDAAEGIVHQDLYVAGLIQESRRAVVLAANKWDLTAPGDADAARRLEEQVRRELDFLHFAPLVFISARTGRGIGRLLDQLLVVAENFATRLSPATWQALLNDALSFHQPPARKGRPLEIYSASQVQVRPPTVLLEVNDPERVHFSYLRYLENFVRRAYPLTGTPIAWRLKARARSS
ncbi:MAG: ribosome biogenesis GTPase Der [Limnochordales bacterium]|nr:ribosome biogenesis GTPase Der [Limnochordales bacterium]